MAWQIELDHRGVSAGGPVPAMGGSAMANPCEGGWRARRFRVVGVGAVTALAMVALSGCGDRVLETGFGWNYIVEDVEPVEETPIRRMDGSNLTYPTLGRVPSRPHAPISPSERVLLLDRLAEDNRNAVRSSEALAADAPALPEPPTELLDAPGDDAVILPTP